MSYFEARDSDSHRAKSSISYDDFCQEIYKAVLDGNFLKLRSFLFSKRASKEELKRIFDSNTVSLQTTVGPECAPAIVIASKYGHTKLVHFFIKEYNVDINAPGNVKFDGFLIEGATALWCAAGAGHMEIVRCLVENGAQVNKTTNSNSTPLRAACFDGRLDIVRFLVQHKADINIPNRYHNNCLMISAFRGHLSVVRFLLESGIDPNHTAMANATALQFAAETGRIEICQALVESGAKLCCNDSGLDQLFVAAEHAQADVVMYMVTEPKLAVPRLRHIEALELLGAMLLNDKDRYDPAGAYRLLAQALRMRLDAEAGIPTPKAVREPIAAYRHRKECETLQELEEIQYDFELLELEGLMIRERILGTQYSDLTGPIVYRGAVCADLMHFDRCLELWMHALRIRSGQSQSTGKDLLRLAQVLSQMVSLRVDVHFRVVYEVLRVCCEELHRSRLRCQSHTDELEAYSQDVHTAFYLLALLCKVKMTAAEEQLSYRLVHGLVRADFRLPTGNSLLHMACDPNTEIDSFHVSSAVHVPNCTVIKLLLVCGADPNTMADTGDTPLHLVVRYDRALPDFLTLESAIVTLAGFGAHPDLRNCLGQRPRDLALAAAGSGSSGGGGGDGSGGGGLAALVLSSCCRHRLLCLAAEAVAKFRLPLSQLPQGLAEFVRLHASEASGQQLEPRPPVGIGPGPTNPLLRALSMAQTGSGAAAGAATASAAAGSPSGSSPLAGSGGGGASARVSL